VIVNARVYPSHMVTERFPQITQGAKDGWGVKNGTRTRQRFVHFLPRRITAAVPGLNERAGDIPVRVAPRGERFADTRGPITEADVGLGVAKVEILAK